MSEALPVTEQHLSRNLGAGLTGEQSQETYQSPRRDGGGGFYLPEHTPTNFNHTTLDGLLSDDPLSVEVDMIQTNYGSVNTLSASVLERSSDRPLQPSKKRRQEEQHVHTSRSTLISAAPKELATLLSLLGPSEIPMKLFARARNPYLSWDENGEAVGKKVSIVEVVENEDMF